MSNGEKCTVRTKATDVETMRISTSRKRRRHPTRTQPSPEPFAQVSATRTGDVEWFDSPAELSRAMTADYMVRGRGRMALISVLFACGLAMGLGLFLSLFF